RLTVSVLITPTNGCLFMIAYLWVAIGGALGSVGRFWFSNIFNERFGDSFPWSTLIINVTGSFAIRFFGTLTSAEGRMSASLGARRFFMTGICGGYTTFSAFSLQTLSLAQSGEWGRAGAYVVASVVLCLLAVWVGHLLAMIVNPAKGG